MKAIVCTKYGPPEVLHLKEVEKPTPKDNEVLVKIHATSVHIGDCRLRSFTVPPLFRLPFRLSVGFKGPRKKILGSELAGEVEAVGKDVKRFKDGDQVFGNAGAVLGTYAEYVCLPEKAILAKKPTNMSYEEAAAGPDSTLSALYYLRKGGIQSGQKVLINGASGALGTTAVQLAKHFGAEVTGVCSTTNLELVKSIGADKVIDYTKEDFTKGTARYDVIMDNVGSHSLSATRRVLTPTGVHIPNSGHAGMGWVIAASLAGMFVRQQAAPFVAATTRESLLALKDLIEAGRVAPVVDRTFRLGETAEAFAYLDEGHARGKVVITI